MIGGRVLGAGPSATAAAFATAVALGLLGGLSQARAEDQDGGSSIVRTCPTEPGPSVRIYRAPWLRGGGIAGDGWDGPGLGSATLFWHVEGASPDFSAGQRTALIAGLQAWASVVDVDFVELPVPNQERAVDFDFLVGDHSVVEPAEAGDPDCPFDGANGTLAHAGFPPGVSSACVDPMPETFAGNVHFDEAETWEQDTGSGAAFSLTLIACHEIGHAIGLVHDNSGGGDVMRPTFGPGDGFVGLSEDDIANAQSGYAVGPGAVVTLETTGVWVDSDAAGPELGTSAQPFNTVVEGTAGVPPLSTGIVVHIDAGNYPGGLLVTQNMVLRAENGVVTIGN